VDAASEERDDIAEGGESTQRLQEKGGGGFQKKNGKAVSGSAAGFFRSWSSGSNQKSQPSRRTQIAVGTICVTQALLTTSVRKRKRSPWGKRGEKRQRQKRFRIF